MDQILLIKKPKSWTSHDVVAKLRSLLKEKKVGHAGTLDPFATGLLIILTGKKTKEADLFLKLDKEYLAKIHLGIKSSTFDIEGEKQKINIAQPPAPEKVKEALKNFEGVILQTPPQFSAIKVKGQPAYKLARKGEKVKLKPRNVKIYEIKILNYDWPCLKIKVRCGSGTYIRSLAHDIGKVLGVGGYLFALTRTKIGEFDLRDAKSIEDFKK